MGIGLTMETSEQNNFQKKIAIINDLSGYGRCSITVQLPIISAMGIQTCPIPTGIFTNHTGFDSFAVKDCTDFLHSFIDEWKKVNISFDGILIGYLTNPAQIDFAKTFIEEFGKESTVILDPVMADNGEFYSGYDSKIAERLSELISYADILTPNVTESCILTGKQFKPYFKTDELTKMAEILTRDRAKRVVITGIDSPGFVSSFAFESENKESYKLYRKKKCHNERPGTGDVFSAVIAADALNGIEFLHSVERASDFVAKTLKVSDQNNTDSLNGVCFEKFMSIKI